MNVKYATPGICRRFHATEVAQGRNHEPVRLVDIVELILLFCTQEGISFLVVLLRLFWQFSNPKGLNKLPDFREQVCATPTVSYANPKSKPAKEHLTRQVELVASALLAVQNSIFRDPLLIEISGVHYVKCDAIMTTTTCPEAGGYDVLFPGARAVRKDTVRFFIALSAQAA